MNVACFNKEWADEKTEAEFVAEFKGMEHIDLTVAELSDMYYAVTGKERPTTVAYPTAAE